MKQFLKRYLRPPQSKQEQIESNKIQLDKGDISLVILTESPNRLLTEYFAQQGIYAEKIYYSIDDVSVYMLTHKQAVRLVIIEQGMGELYTGKARKDIQELLSICDGVFKKVLFFYTKPYMRYDNKNYDTDMIRWVEFDGFPQVVSEIRLTGETYKVSDTQFEQYSPILDYTTLKLPELPTMKQGVETRSKIPELISTIREDSRLQQAESVPYIEQRKKARQKKEPKPV